MPTFTSTPRQTIHSPIGDELKRASAMLAATGQEIASFGDRRRDAYDAMTAKTDFLGDPDIETVSANGINGCWIVPRPVLDEYAILFLHGGAYSLGSANAYRGFASQIAARTGVATFVLDYPLAPEAPFPAAYESSLRALHSIRSQGRSRIALVGDSAGGGLALALIGTAEVHDIASTVVFSPWTDLMLTGASFNDPATRDPVFQPAMLSMAAKVYLGEADPRDARASPLYSLPANPPPLMIQVGTEELLLDDARRYARAAAERGGEVALEIFEGMHHVFQRAVGQLPGADAAWDLAASFISAHW